MAWLPSVSLLQLRLALDASWAPDTAYLGVYKPGNSALGQCYPTSRVVQWFFPDLEITTGEVDTGSSLETHFWNIDCSTEPPEHVDLTWQQFPSTSRVVRFRLLDRNTLGDSPPTVLRCRLLLKRVLLALGHRDCSDCLEAAQEGGTCGVGAEMNNLAVCRRAPDEALDPAP